MHLFPETLSPAGFGGYLKLTKPKKKKKSFLSFWHARGVVEEKTMLLGGGINLPELCVLGPHD